MKLYKLTDATDQTSGGTQWGEGVTHRVRGKGPPCSAAWLHAYESPLMAVAMDSQHAVFLPDGHLWEAEGGPTCLREGDLKIGVKTLTTVRRIEIPVISTTARVRWAILCAWEVCEEPSWRRWAAAWLIGCNRSAVAADVAAEFAWEAKAGRYPAAVAAKSAAFAVALVWEVAAAPKMASASVDAAWAAGSASPLPVLALLERAIAEEAAINPP